MTGKQIKNLPASIHRRLLDLARARGETLPILLNRFVAERFLYRLSLTEHRARFVLKGAALLSVWSERPHRPTRDIDLLGIGDRSMAGMERTFREVCNVSVEDDGLVFDMGSLVLADIREEQEYGGVRVTLKAFLGKAKIPLQIDVGFGDVVTPQAEEIEFGGLLGFPPARMRAYPRESVIAEKLEAMVTLDLANSRMKDFYDLYQLSQEFAFDGRVLCEAISATFRRRGTPMPTQVPVALSRAFYQSTEKQAQWAGFVRKSELNKSEVGLAEVCKVLESFLAPPLQAAADEAPFDLVWRPGGPWRSRSGGS